MQGRALPTCLSVTSRTQSSKTVPPPRTLSAGRIGVSLRAILVGSIGVVIVCAVVAGTELVYVKAGFLQLPPAALGGLLILVAGRQLLGQRSRWRLQSQELAGIYGMLLV